MTSFDCFSHIISVLNVGDFFCHLVFLFKCGPNTTSKAPIFVVVINTKQDKLNRDGSTEHNFKYL